MENSNQHENHETVSQTLIEYNITNAKLAELEKEFSGKVPDASTKDGYNKIKSALKVLTPLRTGVEKKRQELKKDALEWGRKVDSEAKRITGRIEALENPYKDAKKEEDDRKKRMEQERIDRLEAKIQRITDMPRDAHGKNSSEISAIIDLLDREQIEDFYEYSKTAAIAKSEAMDTLIEMMQIAIQSEQAEVERKIKEEELAAKEEELRIQQAIDRLKNIPTDYLGRPSIEITDKIDALRNYVPNELHFGDRLDEAKQLLVGVIEKLQKLAGMACQEEAEAKRDQESETATTEVIDQSITDPSNPDPIRLPVPVPQERPASAGAPGLSAETIERDIDSLNRFAQSIMNIQSPHLSSGPGQIIFDEVDQMLADAVDHLQKRCEQIKNKAINAA